MKYLLLLILLFIFVACGGNEAKFEAFSPESFAFDIGNSWEVNALINVKGFEEKETEGQYSASIYYIIDLISPDGSTVKNIFEDRIEKESTEEITDIPLEAQFELDSTYTVGKYNLLFKINDNYSGKSTEAKIEFELSE